MKTVEAKRPRGRPRAFDQDAVLAAVLDVFWTKGYSAASLDDLAAAAGVTRPSLYTALGDKRSMYLGALAHFERVLEGQLAASLDPAKPLRDGLCEFYLGAVDLYLSGNGPPRGCLIVCTAATEAAGDAETRRALARVLARLDTAFEQRIAAEIGAGGEPPERASALARLASAILHSLAVRARAGEARPTLVQLAEAGATFVASSAASASWRHP